MLGGVNGVGDDLAAVVDNVVVTVAALVAVVVVVVFVGVSSGTVSLTAAVRRILKCDHQHSLCLWFVGCPACYCCCCSCSVSFAVVNANGDVAVEVRAGQWSLLQLLW